MFLLIATHLFGSIEIIQLNNSSFDDCNGLVVFRATGSAGPFQVRVFNSLGQQTHGPESLGSDWQNVNGDKEIKLLCPGVYTLEVSGDNFCESDFTFEIMNVGETCPYSSLNVEIINRECVRSFIQNDGYEDELAFQDGLIQIEISGGSPFSNNRYHIEWSTGEIGVKKIRPDYPGYYGVTVTDSDNCKVMASAQINDSSEEMEFEYNIEYVTQCDILDGVTGEVQIFVDGGNSPFQYEWFKLPNVTQALSTSSLLEYNEEGHYQLRVIDDCGSSKAADFYLGCKKNNQDCGASQIHIDQKWPCFEKKNPYWPWDNSYSRLVLNPSFNNPFGPTIVEWPDKSQTTISRDGIITGKLEWAPSSEGTYNVEVISGGCFEEHVFEFDKPRQGERKYFSTQVNELKPLIAYQDCLKQCGGVCLLSGLTSGFEYIPNNSDYPCSFGGTLKVGNKEILIPEDMIFYYLTPEEYNSDNWILECNKKPACLFEAYGIENLPFSNSFLVPICSPSNEDTNLDCQNIDVIGPVEGECAYVVRCLDNNTIFEVPDVLVSCYYNKFDKYYYVEQLCQASCDVVFQSNPESYTIEDFTSQVGDIYNMLECPCTLGQELPDVNTRSKQNSSIETETKIQLSPNPVSDFLNVTFNQGQINKYNYYVYSMGGNLTMNGSGELSEDSEVPEIIDVSSLIPGLYYLNIVSKGFTTSKKFIVAK